MLLDAEAALGAAQRVDQRHAARRRRSTLSTLGEVVAREEADRGRVGVGASRRPTARRPARRDPARSARLELACGRGARRSRGPRAGRGRRSTPSRPPGCRWRGEKSWPRTLVEQGAAADQRRPERRAERARACSGSRRSSAKRVFEQVAGERAQVGRLADHRDLDQLRPGRARARPRSSSAMLAGQVAERDQRRSAGRAAGRRPAPGRRVGEARRAVELAARVVGAGRGRPRGRRRGSARGRRRCR